ncbi:MAG: ParB/RepB/Spo0J family partition protein [Candidatus Omnitrophota bacterium]
MEGKALGKGLAALIPDQEKSEGVMYLKTAQIKDSSLQPRQDYDPKKLEDLIASIKEKGVLQPILVRKRDDGFEIIAGERRLRAARELGMDDMPVIIKSATDQEALVLALVENIQREELNAIEEANAYKRLINEFQYTQDVVAQSVGKDRTTITNILRLLKLPLEIQQSISSNIISMGHARSLLSLDNPQKQKSFFDKTIKKGLSVRELENSIKRELGTTAKTRKTAQAKDPYVRATEEDLQRTLGTKVRIDHKKKNGKIIIEYYSPEDLERLTELIKK